MEFYAFDNIQFYNYHIEQYELKIILTIPNLYNVELHHIQLNKLTYHYEK
jgi:hypothetical protein